LKTIFSAIVELARTMKKLDIVSLFCIISAIAETSILGEI